MTGTPMTSNRRAYRSGGLSRYANDPVTTPTPRAAADLRSDHPASILGHSIFPSSVYDAGQRDRILINGINNAKIGKRVTKGPWAGFPIYTFALEERATCPRSCVVWRACYGNSLPVATRFRFNAGFLMSLEEELVQAAERRRNRNGFVVRAHVLGDFPSLEYVNHWRLWLELVPQLHVFGYTAHPRRSDIGSAVLEMNERFAGRWAFRSSVDPDATASDWQTAAIWTADEMVWRDGIICPAETGKTATCGTCALCWSPNAKDKRILFLGHGMRRAHGPRELAA